MKEGTDIFVCQNTPLGSSVSHYYATEQMSVELVSEAEPQMAISNADMNVVDGNLTCQFTMNNSLNAMHVDYTQFYMLVAYETGENLCKWKEICTFYL